MARLANALIVTADSAATALFTGAVTRLGLAAIHSETGADALQRVEELALAVVILDLELTDAPGLPLTRCITDGRHVPLIAVAPAGNVRLAVEAMRNGATDVLDARATLEELEQAIHAVLPRAAGPHHEEIFGRNPAMQALEADVARVAAVSTPVLIRGEGGVGKEVIARVIHRRSDRSERPFLKLALTALPADCTASELEATVATTKDGTLFLDEIGEASAVTQERLLRLLARHDPKPRVISSTSADLHRLVTGNVFRRDLYQRLTPATIDIPPLRERREEIDALTWGFLERFAREFQRPRPTVSKSMAELFRDYAWPGNVRELEAIVKRWVVLGDERRVRAEIEGRRAAARRQHLAKTSVTLGLHEIGRRAAREAERLALQEALLRARGNRAAVARELRVSYRTILQKLTEVGLLTPSRGKRAG